jgi:hypothetical protein
MTTIEDLQDMRPPVVKKSLAWHQRRSVSDGGVFVDHQAMVRCLTEKKRA